MFYGEIFVFSFSSIFSGKFVGNAKYFFLCFVDASVAMPRRRLCIRKKVYRR